MDAANFLKRFLLFASVVVLMLQTREVESKKSKIVFLPLPAVSSQYFVVLQVAEEMASRDHMVSILTTNMIRKRKSIVKHIEYQAPIGEAELNALFGKYSKGTGKASFSAYLPFIRLMMNGLVKTCRALVTNDETLNEIKNADMLVSVSPHGCVPYLAEIFDKPYILVHPGPLAAIGAFAQVPVPPSYVPLIGTTDEMTFIERTKNFVVSNVKNIVMDTLVTYYFKDFQKEMGSTSTESYAQIFGKAELYIVSTMDFVFEYAHPLMPNVFVVGPMQVKPGRPLPDDLENFMQSSGEHGVVLISFGSVISSVNHVILEKMVDAISKLKQKVIWKVNMPKNITVPENLKVVDWLPQNDLLGHAKTKAFVSHMGLNSASEAAYHGVPIVASCIMSDSFANAKRFSGKAKMAKFIDIYTADVETWRNTIEEVLFDPKYKTNAMRVSKLMRSWPRTSSERAGDLIEYAIVNGGRLPHLRSTAGNLYWFQYHCIDVIVFLISVIFIILLAVCKVFKLFVRCVCTGSKKQKKE